MAKKNKADDAPKGSPAWMATFSDLMNLLLCFFVLLFSMSSVDEAKFEEVIASLQSSFSILSGGGTSIGEGEMISAGLSQLKEFDIYYNPSANSNGDGEGDGASQEDENAGAAQTQQDVQEAYEQEGLSESEQMAEQIEQALAQEDIADQVEMDFTSQYVLLTLNGALLFDSGKADVKKEALPLVRKVASIVGVYDANIIEVEGHTDNNPISNHQFENNDVLSTYRAMSVTNIIRRRTDLDPSLIKFSGRGEYVPIADNSTAEGRARNRRVEIKIYNTQNSD